MIFCYLCTAGCVWLIRMLWFSARPLCIMGLADIIMFYCVLCSSPLSITIVTCNLSFPFQIECMVAAEIMQRYKKLQFERGRWPAVKPTLNPTTEGG